MSKINCNINFKIISQTFTKSWIKKLNFDILIGINLKIAF